MNTKTNFLAVLLLATLAGTASAAILNSDPGFEAQTVNTQVGLPWSPVGPGQTVVTSAQSPFANIAPLGTQGLSTPQASGAYIVGSAGSTAANATGFLYFNVDFRNNSADVGDYSLVVTADADGNRASTAFTVSGTTLYANNASSTPNGNVNGINVASLTVGTWYNLQATLNLNDDTYSGVLTPFGSSPIAIVSRSFIKNDVINNIYTDSGSFQMNGGVDPNHDIDNFALSNTPLAAAPVVNVVNVDLNGQRNNPGPDSLGSTYSGVGAGNGGTVFNGVTADSRSGAGDNDNLAISASNLVSSTGSPTPVSFSISPVGGDNNNAPPAPTSPTSASALFGDYVFNNSAGNGPGQTSTFSIDNLPANSLVDLYFYIGAGSVTVTGDSPSAFTGSGIFTSGNTLFFDDVLVSALGSVTGTLPSAGVNVLHGFSVVYQVPEPSSLMLAAIALCGVAFTRRRVARG